MAATLAENFASGSDKEFSLIMVEGENSISRNKVHDLLRGIKSGYDVVKSGTLGDEATTEPKRTMVYRLYFDLL
jgi:hypothetical protein